MTTDAAFQLAWGPGTCGFMLSLALFGATLGQSIFYFWYFQDDLKSLKAVVLVLMYVKSTLGHPLGI
ncbi:hypothetical protein HYDPIDRAFT_29785 [Hydnomerulius pinastri MD-312]|uniref:Uncharacterized protein n=1 Tax=Hydnomerulius pinastri MD-312 TaxID=994086 RepID=A0A0C9WDJ8_9AGAM|nr:hypothetical protein HYDPIDRAFT_29785 [Hydnomerulius pinastri MD-312]